LINLLQSIFTIWFWEEAKKSSPKFNRVWYLFCIYTANTVPYCCLGRVSQTSG